MTRLVHEQHGRPPILGVLHPDALGTALAVEMRPRLAVVLWAEEDPPGLRTKRAEWADFTAVRSVGDLVRRSDIILASGTSAEAAALAGQVAAAGGVDIYLDATGAPAARIERLIGAARLVRARVTTPPPWPAGTGRVVLAGDRADEVGALFANASLTVEFDQQ